MLALRLASAVIGIPVVLGAVWLGGPWLIGLAGAIAALGLLEYHRLAKAFTKTFPFLLTIALALGIAVAAASSGAHLAIALAAGIAATLALHFAIWRGVSLVHRAVAVAGPFYLVAPLTLAVLLREGDDGLEWALTAILCTFAVDTAAFAVGKLLGQTPTCAAREPGQDMGGHRRRHPGWRRSGVRAYSDIGVAAALLAGGRIRAAARLGSGLGRPRGVRAEARGGREGLRCAGAGARRRLDRMDSLLATITVTYLWVGWAL